MTPKIAAAPTTTGPLSTIDRQRAAWESTTVQTMNPLLSDADAATLWTAIVGLRAQPLDGPSITAFTESARGLVAPHPTARGAMESCLTALSALVAGTSGVPAGVSAGASAASSSQPAADAAATE